MLLVDRGKRTTTAVFRCMTYALAVQLVFGFLKINIAARDANYVYFARCKYVRNRNISTGNDASIDGEMPQAVGQKREC